MKEIALAFFTVIVQTSESRGLVFFFEINYEQFVKCFFIAEACFIKNIMISNKNIRINTRVGELQLASIFFSLLMTLADVISHVSSMIVVAW